MTRKKDIDFILESIVGGNGLWQWKNVLILYPLLSVGGYPLFISIFAAYTPPHRCLIPVCDTPNSVLDEPFMNFSAPSGKNITVQSFRL